MAAEPTGKLATGIPGLDVITHGGLALGRTTLVAGSPGSAKTVFGAQFLVAGVTDEDQPGVFVTLEESPSDIRSNLISFGWDVEAWEAEGKWTFVDASPDTDPDTIVVGEFDFKALVARVLHAVDQLGAKRVVIDSIGAVFSQYDDQSLVRREIRRIADALRSAGVTSIVTVERLDEFGPVARHDVEAFVTDSVVILRNVLEDEQVRRSVQVLKLRGSSHQKGEFPFTITTDVGITVLPLSTTKLQQGSADERVTSGVAELDQMCNGGLFKDSIILVSGATGTGKTLTVTEFLAGGVRSGERVLLSAFEESRDQLFRNARGWGFDFESMEASGELKVICMYPEELGIEEHLVMIQRELEEFKPDRFAIDSLSALERVTTPRAYRQFVIGMTSWLKDRRITGMFTATTPTLLGGDSVTIAHISTLTDTIILLRYVELLGKVRRGIAVLKMRGSTHDKDIREVTIDESGLRIGEAFRSVGGILSGAANRVSIDELDRLDELLE